MKKFILQSAVFLLPLLILLLIPAYILWKSGENFYNIETLLNTKKKYIIGYVYNENNYDFLKWKHIVAGRKKTLWSLGSSRVLQFRKNMFNTSFYNAGYTIESINDFRVFLQSIPKDKYPDYLIIGLDQWMFNYAWDSLKVYTSVDSWKNKFSFYPKFPATYINVYKDLFYGKYFLNSFNQGGNILKVGMNALVNNKGFRNDGSFYYGAQIKKLIKKDKTAEDYNYKDTFRRIKGGVERFQYGKIVNKEAIEELERLLNYCKNNNIQVIAFLPPFADKVYSRMLGSKNYGYMGNIYRDISPVFTKYKYELYDFSHVSVCGSNDGETLDGFHGSEVTYQKILINMVNSGSALASITDGKKLKSDLSNSKNNYTIYNY